MSATGPRTIDATRNYTKQERLVAVRNQFNLIRLRLVPQVRRAPYHPRQYGPLKRAAFIVPLKETIDVLEALTDLRRLCRAGDLGGYGLHSLNNRRNVFFLSGNGLADRTGISEGVDSGDGPHSRSAVGSLAECPQDAAAPRLSALVDPECFIGRGQVAPSACGLDFRVGVLTVFIGGC